MVAQIIEVVDVQDYLGQQCLNVYHFVNPDGVADPAALIPVFDADVTPLILPTQNPAVSHRALRWRTVYPLVGLIREFAVNPNKVGSNAGTPEPAFVAWSLKFTIDETQHLDGDVGPRIRASGKRIVGVDTGSVTGNDPTTGGTINTLFATWFAELQEPGADNWQLCAVHLPFVKGTPQQPVSRYALVTACSNPGIGSQNTRKVLRGRTF